MIALSTTRAIIQYLSSYKRSKPPPINGLIKFVPVQLTASDGLNPTVELNVLLAFVINVSIKYM
jgi:hypothetical protein